MQRTYSYSADGSQKPTNDTSRHTQNTSTSHPAASKHSPPAARAFSLQFRRLQALAWIVFGRSSPATLPSPAGCGPGQHKRRMIDSLIGWWIGSDLLGYSLIELRRNYSGLVDRMTRDR